MILTGKKSAERILALNQMFEWNDFYDGTE